MKKLLNISVIAALAVLPVAANATLTARTVTAQDNVTAGAEGGALATASYVQGAYNAANSQINALISDTAVAAKQGGYEAIESGATVGANLVALDEAIAGLSSDTTTTIGNLAGLDDSFGTGDDKANTVVEALDSLDDRLDTAESEIDTLQGQMGSTTISATGLTANTVTGAVVELQNDKQEKSDSTVATAAAGTYTAIQAGNAVGANLEALDSHVKTAEAAIGTKANLTTTDKTDLVSAINEVNSAVSSLNTSAGNTYQTLSDSNVAAGTYDHLTAGQGVGTNLIALDTAVSTIERKQIPIVSDWSTNAVTNTTISSLSGTVDCTLSANALNPACQQ